MGTYHLDTPLLGPQPPQPVLSPGNEVLLVSRINCLTSELAEFPSQLSTDDISVWDFFLSFFKLKVLLRAVC